MNTTEALGHLKEIASLTYYRDRSIAAAETAHEADVEKIKANYARHIAAHKMEPKALVEAFNALISDDAELMEFLSSPLAAKNALLLAHEFGKPAYSEFNQQTLTRAAGALAFVSAKDDKERKEAASSHPHANLTTAVAYAFGEFKAPESLRKIIRYKAENQMDAAIAMAANEQPVDLREFDCYQTFSQNKQDTERLLVKSAIIHFAENSDSMFLLSGSTLPFVVAHATLAKDAQLRRKIPSDYASLLEKKTAKVMAEASRLLSDCELNKQNAHFNLTNAYGSFRHFTEDLPHYAEKYGASKTFKEEVMVPLQIFEQALAAQYFANDFHSAPLHRAALGRTMRKHPRVASRMHVLGLISDSTYTRYAKCSGFVGIFRSIRHSWRLYDYAQANREAVQSEEVVH